MVADGDRLLAVGLSHHTAPVEVRERVAFDEDAVRQTLNRLVRHEQIAEEAFLISTCNRVELYAVPRSVEGLQAFFGSYRGPTGERIDPYLYWYRGRDAVRHLFKVASSLDSLVVGEPQILGQVKDAVRLAEETSTLGRLLHPLTQRTLSVAKLVRSSTEIGQNRVGIGNAGVDLAMQIFGSLDGRRAMLVGVGEMGRQVARALLSAGLSELLVANRTFERSVELASEHGGTPVPYERLADYLPRADIVITATGAQHPILTVPMIRQALRDRRYRTLFLVDLAVPRNIDPGVAELDEAYLFNVDDLSRVVEEGKAAREQAARQALALVDDEADRFLASLREIDVATYLRAMNDACETIRAAEIERSRKLVSTLQPAQLEQLDAMTKAMVKKLLHKQMMAVRAAAKSGDEEKLRILMEPWSEEER
ncbi:MAG: glutamyl-tRNA reductase [Alphaproteobacteria bacterium]|nr:glutamyl-tRNA reductase [Alphaproteobacteria bacterium]MCB9690181.1 glutamyl-tRNA reductase [Alphaproteobacteria bacterium]MCB9696391.1 glutamyl-tRNA reductase [Alphaproteobacteria bacterium]